MANVTVKLDRAHLAAKMRNASDHCGKELAEQILGDSRPFTPHANGSPAPMEDTGKVEKIGDDYAVTYNTVYAAYQWYGCWPDGSHVIKNHDTSVNSQATTQWIEAAKKQHGRDWHTVAQREHVKGFKK